MDKLMKDDIVEIARYAAGLDFIDSTNIFVLGSSFGAYLAASLMLTQSDLFKAGICCAGVYDFSQFFNCEPDDTLSDASTYYQNAFIKKLGLPETFVEHQSEMERVSPAYHLSRLKKPLLVIHGTEDKTANVQQAIIMQEQSKALLIDGSLVNVKIIKGADHDFSKHKKLLWSNILEFIDKNTEPQNNVELQQTNSLYDKIISIYNYIRNSSTWSPLSERFR